MKVAVKVGVHVGMQVGVEVGVKVGVKVAVKIGVQAEFGDTFYYLFIPRVACDWCLQRVCLRHTIGIRFAIDWRVSGVRLACDWCVRCCALLCDWHAIALR